MFLPKFKSVFKIVVGQPSDRLGEDFSEYYKDFTEVICSF